jgi:ubiquinone/menaquinone biosynthesis C-methylase UbiE
LKGAQLVHASTRDGRRPTGDATAKTTTGLVLQGGWRYDLHGWFVGIFLFRGKGRELRRRTITLAGVHPGEQVLDVGCGTGTLALDVARRVGTAGRVVGIDPSPEQIVRARAKAARRYGAHALNTPAAFQVGVIEQLPFPDQTFDVVLSTLMMHHLPAPLKRQGLAEIVRVLKPGGRLVIADFARKQDHQGLATRFHAGGSSLGELAALVADAGLSQVDSKEMPPPRFSAFPGAGFVTARKP